MTPNRPLPVPTCWPRSNGSARADGWCTAISAALDDRDLARAVATVTRPVAALGRRSTPAVRAELIGWAATVARRCPQRRLREALLADLRAGSARPPAQLDGDLLDPPGAPAQAVSDLTARIDACLRASAIPDPPDQGATR